MKKLIVSTVVALSLLGAGIASAQSACVSISPTLTLGSRGTQVTQLQSFLVSRGYPGGGNWMVTGYFGQATQSAVRIFQSEQGLPQTGVVDSATASAISNVSCGYGYQNPFSNYNYNYNYNYSGYTSPWYPYGQAPAITSLSQNTGVPGNSVTIYGSGFDPVNNTVNFGSQAIPGIPSVSGTSLTFTVPSYYTSYTFAGTSIQLSVGNSRGTSNTIGFTLYGGGYGYGGCGTYPYNTYPYNTQCGYNYPPSNPNVVTLQYLSPAQGGVGTSVTVYGSGFTATGNTVHFGSGIMTGLNAPDGRSVSFVVPSQLTGFGSQIVTLGTYGVSVTNGLGISSGTLPFTVTSTDYGSGAPVISSVNGPTSLGTGVQGTWTLTLSNTNNAYVTVSVNWGDSQYYGAAAQPQTLYMGGTQTTTFTHTYYTAGTYTLTFTASNAAGQSNTYTSTVSVGGTTIGAPAVSYLSPAQGRVGTQIAIVGSGFTPYNNTVHFDVGGTQNLPSVNGTTIYYTIPYSVSPCDVNQYFAQCTMMARQVTPGTYSVSVTNQGGSSNTLWFTVTY
jgi:peptidoglycan hydrolase-like protein with peptidoglycan-binding domain